MARTHRVVVFLNEGEWGALKATQPTDASMSATLRRAAMARLTWLAERSLKQQPILQKDMPKVPGWQRDPNADDGPQFISDPQ